MTDRFFKEIEEGPLYSELMLASTTKIFLKAVRNSSTLKKVRVDLASSPARIDAYVARVSELLDMRSAEGFAHDYDLIIAAYLYVLGLTNDQRARVLLRQVSCDDRHDIWWSQFIANYVIDANPVNREVPITNKWAGPAFEYYDRGDWREEYEHNTQNRPTEGLASLLLYPSDRNTCQTSFYLLPVKRQLSICSVTTYPLSV